jgi:TatD DNase family protein
VHCFTGGPKDLSPFVEWGFCISFSGVLTYKNAPEVREAARLVPAEQCLVETDAPWLAPTPHRGKQNEPAYVIHTAERLAEERGVTFDEIALQTTANASRLFGLSIGE